MLSLPALIATTAVLGAGHRGFGSTTLGWPTHGGDPTHAANATVPSQNLGRILWQAPIDLVPQYSGDDLLAHYGSPVVTAGNVVVFPVKTGPTSGFRVEARNASTGAVIWQQTTDYVAPSHNWFPSMGPTLVYNGAAYPRKAGLVGFRDALVKKQLPDGLVCFYGINNYAVAPDAYDAAIRISSPLVTGPDTSVYFTYRVEGSTPLKLKGGIARITRAGDVRYVEGTVASGDTRFFQPKLNAAPTIRNNTVYAVFKDSGSTGVIVGLDALTLVPKSKAPLLDPRNGVSAYVDDDGTACPSVGPDGDVYMGVLEGPFGSHHYRGWLLHFDSTLSQSKTPSSFGWDDTASIVPSQLVGGYMGKSSYLLLTKYNNYVGQGDGVNRVAVLDPNDTQTDPYSGVTTMKEVITKVGPTPDTENTGSFPSAVREWCVNTAAIDPFKTAAFVNNEDGVLYRWNLATNTLDQKIRLNAGIGQAYTPTLISPAGVVIAISNAKVYAIGQ